MMGHPRVNDGHVQGRWHDNWLSGHAIATAIIASAATVHFGLPAPFRVSKKGLPLKLPLPVRVEVAKIEPQL